MSGTVTTIDFAPLSEPVSDAALSAFTVESREAGQPWAKRAFDAADIVATVFIALFALILSGIGLIMVLSILVAVEAGESLTQRFVGLALVILVGLAPAYFGRGIYR